MTSGYGQLSSASTAASSLVSGKYGGTKLAKDLATLQTDAGTLSGGASNDTSYVTADLQVVYADCGQQYPS